MPNKLAVGTYQYNDTTDALSFDYASIFDNTNGGNTEISFKSGTVKVTKSENNYYELTFEGIDTDNRQTSGQFFGKVNYSVEL